MYTIKKNHETGKLELVKTAMACHPSIIKKDNFDAIFSREYARYEYFQLDCKTVNGTATQEDGEKMRLLRDNFDFDLTVKHTVVNDILCKEVRQLMILTLYAHGKLFSDVKTDNDHARIVSEEIALPFDDLYKVCKQAVRDFMTGDKTVDDIVKVVKPVYNQTSLFINHDAVDGEMKKWKASTKEHVSRSFVAGLLPKHKITRTNKIKQQGVTDSMPSFRKYVAMWFVTDGNIQEDKKTNKKSLETWESVCEKYSK